MNTGAVTYEKAVDIACKDMLNAGLNCVEYKNGARHTLVQIDADMAVKTANKRAYLRGEGEKRAEWGVSLVVVNSRQGGCPDCAKYIGKVFIDDVYSNGKKSDGTIRFSQPQSRTVCFIRDVRTAQVHIIPNLMIWTHRCLNYESKSLTVSEELRKTAVCNSDMAERFDRRAEYKS